jgi:K+-sensing histidine kinase KdpD
MLRSVLTMSERRASFVSSVTHELRTPLTTFRLYSDLLSSGMVKDKEKQQIYLNTLKHESERLTHLVENVLSYSQIERGSAKAKVETISLYDFVQRIEPRLNERAQEDEMFVNTVFSDSSSDALLNIDITAVEQIIFNLVDNACKYASSEEHGKEITLLAEVKNKKINIQICDQGDGIARSEQKRLFKPFHKSAKEAAHSKPGVGLGLALCKRLAKAMRGDLTITRKSKTKGACFQLSLPR